MDRRRGRRNMRRRMLGVAGVVGPTTSNGPRGLPQAPKFLLAPGPGL